MNNEIHVLWVDDQDLKYFRLNAEQRGIKINRFECWNDAKKELDAHPDKYEVLLLDCMCKFKSTDQPSDLFLTKALGDLKKDIPWLIYTAGADKELEDIVRRLPDNNWSFKGYFRKAEKGVEDELFQNIRKIAEGNPVRKNYNEYKDVFTIIEKRFLPHAHTQNIENIIINGILIPLEENKVEGVGQNIRTVLEKFIEHYLDIGLLTQDFQTKHSVNIKQSIMYLFNENSVLYPDLYDINDQFTKKINKTLSMMYENLSEDVHGKECFDRKYGDLIKKHELNAYCFTLFEIFKWYEAWYSKKEQDLDNIKKKKRSVTVKKDEKNQLFCECNNKTITIKKTDIHENDSIIVLDYNKLGWLNYYQKVKHE